MGWNKSYADVATTAYTRTTEPGPYAQHGKGDSAEVRADANATHKYGSRIYELENNLDAALKQEIIAAVEVTYLSAKNQRYMDFRVVSAKNIADHLMERYGKCWVKDLDA